MAPRRDDEYMDVDSDDFLSDGDELYGEKSKGKGKGKARGW